MADQSKGQTIPPSGKKYHTPLSSDPAEQNRHRRVIMALFFLMEFSSIVLYVASSSPFFSFASLLSIFSLLNSGNIEDCY